MLWRDPRILKGTGSIWSVMLSILFFIAVVWAIAISISDPISRWSIAIIGTAVCLASPGGLASLFWLFSPEYRKQHYNYRRGGPIPGYPPGQPWEGSQAQVGKSLKEYTDQYLSKNTILGSHSEGFQKKLKDEMYGSVAEIYGAENPRMKCREKLAGYVVSFADWAVLGLKPEEKFSVLN
jgi:hypothetical protein